MDKTVAALSGLLGLDPEVVKVSIEEDTLDSRITDFKDKNRVQKKDDFEKFETNLKKETREAYDKELLLKAKSGELEGDLYKAIKGATLQMKEKDVAKKFGITDYNNFDDLLDKATKSQSGGTDDEKVKAFEGKISELKEANLMLDKKATDAVSAVEQKYKNRFLDTELKAAIRGLPFDFNGAEDKDRAIKSVTEMVESVFKNRFDLSTNDDYSAVSVSDKNGEVVKSEATREPVPVSEVLSRLTKEFNIKMKSPEKGGQGGQSSQSSTSNSFASFDELDAAIERGDIKAYSEEDKTARRKLIAAEKE